MTTKKILPGFIEITWEELQEGLEASIMLDYLESHSSKLVDNLTWVRGFFQGWKDRKKFEQWWNRRRRNEEICDDYQFGFCIRDLMEKYNLSRSQIYRITKKVRGD